MKIENKYKLILPIVITVVLITLFLLFKDKPGTTANGYTKFGKSNYEQLQIPKIDEEIAIIKTNMGEIKIRLLPKIAPKTVENFITLAKEKFYDGYTFDRVEKDFLIQVEKNKEYPYGKSIFGDLLETEIQEGYHHFTGAVGLGTSAEGLGSSTFYIISNKEIEPSYLDMMSMLGEEAGYSPKLIRTYKKFGGVPRLDYNYTIFGQVFYGLDTVFEINNLPVVRSGETGFLKPIDSVIIETIEIVNYEGK